MDRIVIHLDLDAFFCAVEELQNPQLRGKAFAVGGLPDKRGVVASCSYPARKFGVHSAMPMSRAVQICPDLIVMPRRHAEYSRVSGQVMAILEETTPYVEQISIDEAFLDMSGFPTDPETLARRLQTRINHELHLPCSLGVASNKLVAKIANNQGKSRMESGHYPNAIEVVPQGEEAVYLAPLPIRELWGVGPRTAERLNELGIFTIGDIAKQDEHFLMDRFGKLGYDLHLRSRGIDGRPIVTERATKSISNEITFDNDIRDHESLKRTLRSLADSVGSRLRKAELAGKTVQLKLRWSDFTTITRQTTDHHASDDDDWIYEKASMLLDSVWDGVRPVRLIGVGVSGFEEMVRQLSLWQDPEQAQRRKVQDTIDDIRFRFGDDAVQRGSDLTP